MTSSSPKARLPSRPGWEFNRRIWEDMVSVHTVNVSGIPIKGQTRACENATPAVIIKNDTQRVDFQRLRCWCTYVYIYVHVCIYVAVEALSTHVFIEDPPSPGTVALPKRNDMWELSVTWLLKKERPSSGGQGEPEQKNKPKKRRASSRPPGSPRASSAGPPPVVLHQDDVRVLRLVASWTSRDSQHP